MLNPCRPVTRYPPGTTLAVAVGSGVLATMLRGGSIQMARAASRGMRAAYVANTEHWLTIQAVLASPKPSSPMTRT